MLAEQNKPIEAESTFRKAIDLCDSAVPPAASAFRASLATLLAQQGNLDEAKELIETAAPLLENLPVEYAKLLCKKGEVLHIAGERDLAVEAHKQAATIAKKLDLRPESEVVQVLDKLRRLLGAAPESAGVDGEADEDDRELAILEGERLIELGRIELEQASHEKSKQCFNDALETFRALQHRAGEAQAIGLLGSLCLETSDYPSAIEHYLHAIEIVQEIGDKRTETNNLANLGIVYTLQGDYDKAIETLCCAVQAARLIGDHRAEGTTLGNLGNVYSELGDSVNAITHYGRAIEIAQTIGERRSEAIYLGNLGNVYRSIQDAAQAVTHYNRAIEIAQEIGNQRDEGFTREISGNFSGCKAKLRRPKRACDEQYAFAMMSYPKPLVPSEAR